MWRKGIGRGMCGLNSPRLISLGFAVVTNQQIAQMVIMVMLFVGVTGIGTVALYRAKRPGWWLPIVVLAFIFLWPFAKRALG
jgi:hypothetical protein